MIFIQIFQWFSSFIDTPSTGRYFEDDERKIFDKYRGKALRQALP